MTGGKKMAKKKTYKELKEQIRELKGQLKGKENREYKSRLFSFIFGKEENKHWTLSLYNTIHGTSASLAKTGSFLQWGR